MNLCFFGGGAFAETVLRRLNDAHTIRRVITPPPAPAGRKLRLTPPPAMLAAQALALPLARDITPQELTTLNADAIIVCDYGKILPAALLAPAAQTIIGAALNVHPSLLPKWRGAAPIERALLAGDETTGISIMEVREKLDSGAIRAQQKIAINNDATAGALRQQLADDGATLLLQVLAAPDDHPPREQDDTQATYANKTTPEERRLNFNQPARLCLRQVQAFAPAPGAYCLINNERLRILAATIAPPAPAAADNAAGFSPGDIIAANDSGVYIACADGALQITRLQRPGRNAADVAAFLRGYTITPTANIANTDNAANIANTAGGRKP